MSDEHLFNEISGLKQSETDIRHIFSRYINILFTAKWKISDEITEWSKNLINKIQEYVIQQKELLEQQYTKKVSNLNILRDHVLQEASIYEEKKDTEHINELINQCNNLKVELAVLEYINRPIPSIQLRIDEQLTPQNENQTNNEQPSNVLIENHDQNIISNPPTNESPSSTNSPTKSTIDEDLSINKNDKLETNLTHHEVFADKCPICYMIFPQNMTLNNRNIHVNEHYKDY